MRLPLVYAARVKDDGNSYFFDSDFWCQGEKAMRDTRSAILMEDLSKEAGWRNAGDHLRKVPTDMN